MIDIAILRASGLTESQILRVLETEQKERKLSRQASNRKAQQNHRARQHVSNLASVSADPPPAYTTPPKEEREAKKPLSARKCELPSDFEFSDADLAKARAAGWDANRISAECQRFIDHAKANGRKQANWHSAWANWVTSPYQQTSKPNGNGHAPRPGSREDRAERATLAYRRAFLETDDDCAGQDADSPLDGVLPFAKPTRS